jgi:hypothetical protein
LVVPGFVPAVDGQRTRLNRRPVRRIPVATTPT